MTITNYNKNNFLKHMCNENRLLKIRLIGVTVHLLV